MQGGICRWFACMLAAGAIAVGSASAGGQETLFPYSDPAYAAQASTNQTVSSNNVYASLESRLSALEAKVADEEDGAKDLQWYDTSQQSLTVNLGGRVHGDYVLFSDQDAASDSAYGDLENYFQMRRMRLFAEGEGYGVFDYKLELDFSPLDDTWHVAMKDAYVGVREVPFLGYVRVGNFKVPFSLENLTDSNFITFMERGLPNIFVDNQEDGAIREDGRKVVIGACNYSESERFTIGYGVFFDEVDPLFKNRVSDNQGIDIAVRGTWNPIYEAGGRGVLHAGVGYLWSDDGDDLVRFAPRPEVSQAAPAGALIDTGVFNASDMNRVNAELAFVYGPFSMQSELFYVDTNGIAGLDDADFYGAYVYGSWFLTGENRVYRRTTGTFGRVIPNTNFWIVRTVDKGVDWGWGAWELALRWSFVDLDDNFDPELVRGGKLNDLTLGVNWYWNPNMRFMLNYIHAWGDVDGFSEVFGATDTDIVAMRMQVDF